MVTPVGASGRTRYSPFHERSRTASSASRCAASWIRTGAKDRVRGYHVCYQLYLMDRGLTDVYRDGAPCPTDGRKVEGIVLWIAERLPRLVDARARVRDAAAPLMGRLFCLVNRATGKVLQIAGGSPENGAAATQGPSTGAAAQKFWVCHIPNRDLCFLFAHHSKRLFTVQDASDDSGRPAVQWQLGGSDNQLFAVFPDPDQPDCFLLAAEHSRRFLGPAPRATTRLPSCRGAPASRSSPSSPRATTVVLRSAVGAGGRLTGAP